MRYTNRHIDIDTQQRAQAAMALNCQHDNALSSAQMKNKNGLSSHDSAHTPAGLTEQKCLWLTADLSR